jgi:hypothetical protein
LSGYEVAVDFVGRRIQPLQARAHPVFDYSGPEDTTRVSPRGIFFLAFLILFRAHLFLLTYRVLIFDSQVWTVTPWGAASVR